VESGVADALNDEGFLFQKYCAQKIAEAGWTIDAEEYPISDKESLDIKASVINFETSLDIAVVECKRQDPQRKRWAFFRGATPSSKSNPFLIQMHCLHTFEGGFRGRGAGVFRSVMECLNEEKLEYPSCHTTGIEVYKDEKERGPWKTNSEVVYKSCINVAKGINHLFDSEADTVYKTIRYGLKRLEKEKKLFHWKYSLGGTLIPVVITSAPLFSIVFNADQMDVETFKVQFEKLVYEQSKWLVYEFPLPEPLRYYSARFFKMSGENRYAKMHIFIVNGMWVTEFFRRLSESLTDRSEKTGRALHSEYHDFYKPKQK
jgi:hypothetical protein